LETNELCLGEGISCISYIFVILYSLIEVKGIRVKNGETVPKREGGSGILGDECSRSCRLDSVNNFFDWGNC
jgi:hypothetical protein